MQKTLQPETPLTLADGMEMVGGFSECTTSHPAIAAMPISFAPSYTATVSMFTGFELMDFTVANGNTKCYCCGGFRHEACDCATLDRHWEDKCFVSDVAETIVDGMEVVITMIIVVGAREVLPHLQPGNINIIQTTREDKITNDDRENSAVEQETVEGEEAQGSKNWE
jgi:hypothetical protein